MIVDLFLELGPWAWMILGLILLGLEIISAGTFFLWFGLSALCIGFISFFIFLGWQVELFIFAALSLLFVLLGRRFVRRKDQKSDIENLNARGQRLKGHIFTLSAPLLDGRARVSLGDTTWRVESDQNLGEGTKVIVVRVEDTHLIIEPYQES